MQSVATAEATKKAGDANRQASADIDKAGASARSAAVDFNTMTGAQLAAYIATESLRAGTGEYEAMLPSLMEKLKYKLELETKTKEITDQLIESITGEKSAQQARQAAQESSTQARRDAADAERNQANLMRDLNNMIDQQRGKLISLTEQLYEYGKSVRQNMVGTFQSLVGAGLGGKASMDIAGQIAKSEISGAQQRLSEAFTSGQGPFAGLEPGAAMAAFNKLTDALNRGAAGITPNQIDVILGLVDKMGNPTPGTTIVNNIEVSGIVTDPVATGQAVADAINAASAQGGAIISAGAVQ